jgi:hypothetical protein
VPAEPFQYAVLQVVPRVERDERVNVGVVVFCRTRRFLDCRIGLTESRKAILRALAPDVDLPAIEAHLGVIERIVRGEPEAGQLAVLAEPERFRWITSPSSTVIQPTDVHGGLTDDPAATLDQIFASQVA